MDISHEKEGVSKTQISDVNQEKINKMEIHSEEEKNKESKNEQTCELEISGAENESSKKDIADVRPEMIKIDIPNADPDTKNRKKRDGQSRKVEIPGTEEQESRKKYFLDAETETSTEKDFPDAEAETNTQIEIPDAEAERNTKIEMSDSEAEIKAESPVLFEERYSGFLLFPLKLPVWASISKPLFLPCFHWTMEASLGSKKYLPGYQGKILQYTPLSVCNGLVLGLQSNRDEENPHDVYYVEETAKRYALYNPKTEQYSTIHGSPEKWKSYALYGLVLYPESEDSNNRIASYQIVVGVQNDREREEWCFGFKIYHSKDKIWETVQSYSPSRKILRLQDKHSTPASFFFCRKLYWMVDLDWVLTFDMGSYTSEWLKIPNGDFHEELDEMEYYPVGRLTLYDQTLYYMRIDKFSGLKIYKVEHSAHGRWIELHCVEDFILRLGQLPNDDGSGEFFPLGFDVEDGKVLIFTKNCRYVFYNLTSGECGYSISEDRVYASRNFRPWCFYYNPTTAILSEK